MKSIANLLSAVAVATAILTNPTPGKAADLTPDQIDAVQAQLQNLRDTIEGKTSERNRSAWSVFMTASQDDDAAIDLLEKCTKIVDYEREGRDESDFREWQSNQKNRYRDDQYMEGLRLQLRWLAITCKAAETEELETILPEVLSFVQSLTQLSEMPAGPALSAVNGSIFVRAYELERLLRQNKNWETTPFNLAGIYENTILPYLREENPDQLMSAWEKRIAQQTQLVTFLETKQEEQLRGGRDDKRRIQDQQRRVQASRGVLKQHDKDDFLRETLPQLRWSQMIDKYRFIDKVAAAQEMLAFLNDNITNKKTLDWLTQFQSLVSSEASPGMSKDVRSVEPDPAANSTQPTKGPVTAESLGLDN